MSTQNIDIFQSLLDPNKIDAMVKIGKYTLIGIKWLWDFVKDKIPLLPSIAWPSVTSGVLMTATGVVIVVGIGGVVYLYKRNKRQQEELGRQRRLLERLQEQVEQQQRELQEYMNQQRVEPRDEIRQGQAVPRRNRRPLNAIAPPANAP
ncbi:hypothetical protein BLNAU_20976 [Blattamonas nauphoetae]|uniref:Uncharacterized protein n=1 Tax=Blattamonas nauphoetae TaxID=2049346 RepID=A0ABQ9WX82_9EUKA|nr:hypothetical protein BLNAU_20976 [Blattamonas nauphoetae]